MIKLLRYIVGLLFIASAFVKGEDAKGFSFKLEEYFSPSVFNIAFLHDHALEISIAVVLIEMILGLFLLFRIRLKFTLYSLISICLFFAFLTFYSAYYKVVTDCGCFGDAIKLEPWQSFYKDLILLFLLLFLLRYYYKKEINIPTIWGKSSGFLKKILFLIPFFIFIYYIKEGVMEEPIYDFRSYKIGVNLRDEKVKIEKNPSIYKALYVLKNKKTGEELEVNQDDYIQKNYWKDANLELQSGKSKTELFRQGYVSSVDKFKLTNNNFDETDVVLGHPKTILLFSYQVSKLDKNSLDLMEKKLISLRNEGYYVAFVNNQTKKMELIDSFMMDATAIKTIARSNPFVLVLENGTITKKENATTYFKLN